MIESEEFMAKKAQAARDWYRRKKAEDPTFMQKRREATAAAYKRAKQKRGESRKQARKSELEREVRNLRVQLRYYRDEKHRKSVKAKATARSIAKHRTNPVSVMLSNARTRAKKRGLEFTITEAAVQIPATCPVLGIVLDWTLGKQHAGSPSIDRIDNSKGYTPENVRVISCRANQIKRDASLQEILAVCRYMQETQTQAQRLEARSQR